MIRFLLTNLRVPMVSASGLVAARQAARPSMTVFLVMVCLAGLGWLLVLAGLSGGWKKFLSPLLKKVTIGSVAAVALLLTVVLMGVVYRGRYRSGPAPVRVSERRMVRPADKKSPAAHAQSAVSTPPARPVQTASAKPVAPPVPKVPSSPPSTPIRRRELPVTQEAARPKPRMEQSRALNEAKPGRVIPVALSPLPRKTTILVHGANALSQLQPKQMCGAVTPFAGSQVYIKWSPGSDAEQIARQLSKAMDCAQVTVTYASEAAGLAGHGVRVGTHANEGETTDRLRPFADAITAALREQGFTVTEVSGAGIPADQTAILIGSD